MPSVLDKLNLKEEREIVVLHAPTSFEAELQTLRKVKVFRTLGAIESVTFALVFATKKSQVDRLSKSLTSKALGDAILWFAYPKDTSQRLRCDFNRDNGWDVILVPGIRKRRISHDPTSFRTQTCILRGPRRQHAPTALRICHRGRAGTSQNFEGIQ